MKSKKLIGLFAIILVAPITIQTHGGGHCHGHGRGWGWGGPAFGLGLGFAAGTAAASRPYDYYDRRDYYDAQNDAYRAGYEDEQRAQADQNNSSDE